MGRLRVRDLMTDPVVTITPEARLTDAAKLMRSHGVSGLPVVRAEGELVGIVTEGDILAKEAGTALKSGGLLARLRGDVESTLERKAAGRTVAEVMTTPVETAHPREEVRAAARRMATKRFKRLPVVEDGQLVGIISRRDVLNVFARPDEELARAVEAFLLESLFAPPDADVKVKVINGVVGLEGSVLFEDDVRVAEALVRSVDGVVDVINGLTFRARNPSLRRIV